MASAKNEPHCFSMWKNSEGSLTNSHTSLKVGNCIVRDSALTLPYFQDRTEGIGELANEPTVCQEDQWQVLQTVATDWVNSRGLPHLADVGELD